MHAEMLVLRFSEKVVDQPIIYRLVKDYDLEFNLLKATIYPRKEGIIVMELRGHPRISGGASNTSGRQASRSRG